MDALKPGGMENKIKRPYVPEATVRLLINYNKSQKTVLRVNPQLPLEMLLPLVCDKCELRLETAVLLRDRHSKESLDIAKTLNELGLREVFAQDTADKNPLLNHQACTHEVVTRCAVHHMDLSAEKRKQKENRMFLSLCRRLKKKAEIKEMIVSSSSGFPKQKSAGVKQRDISYSNTLAGLPHQKRRAPLPPMGVSRSVPNNLSNFSGSQRSTASDVRRAKRNAPPPPCGNKLQEVQSDIAAKDSAEKN